MYLIEKYRNICTKNVEENLIIHLARRKICSDFKFIYFEGVTII